MANLTYKGDSFYRDGKKHTILSGAMHYFRIPREYWHDRLLKLKECGFNTVETYTAWNLHEPRENSFNFSGNLDIAAFIETAQSLGLDLILRPGPYICSEWELGGLPSWLLKYEKMPLRCYNDEFLAKVKRYYDQLLPRIKPYLSSCGGCITMIQIENEYGSYGDDKKYLRAIAEIYKNNGIDCLYFTSDGPTYYMLNGGTLDEHLATANFGSRPCERLDILKKFRPDQPLMCAEYWCGWFDHWSEYHHTRTAEEVVSDFEEFFRINASFNFYMFHGGTNFGFMNGANYSEKGYEPTTTSYDYCAPLNEAGDRTATYYAIRELVKKYYGTVPPLTASDSKKKAYGKVELTEIADLFDNLDNISAPVFSTSPKYMEDMDQSYGYILYRSTLKGPSEERAIEVDQIHDRVQIFLDGEHKGTYCRMAKPKKDELVTVALDFGESVRLDLLVENMGRINYGPKLLDRKGLSAVRLNNQHHFGWETYCLPMEKELDGLVYKKATEDSTSKPAFLRGYLDIREEPSDTFIRLDGFHKGFVKINGFNIGRYFNDAGPQKTLYVPAPILKKGKNEILVFESDSTDRFSVEFLDKEDLGESAPITEQGGF
ncbi:MAG: beta-galactosidase [Clostridia bacterium]|nr:beta-galactosidase [Clostridia bacterium]